MARHPVAEVCVAVVRRDGRVLVLRRREAGALDGVWEFPGGKRRRGERGDACAARETLEETGLRVAVGREIGVAVWDYGDRRVRVRFFEATAAGAATPAPATAALRWVTPRGLLRMRIPAANRRLVSALAAAPPAPPPRGGTPARRRGPSTPAPSRRATGR